MLYKVETQEEDGSKHSEIVSTKEELNNFLENLGVYLEDASYLTVYIRLIEVKEK